MELEDIVSRLDSIEGQLRSINNSLLSTNTRITEVDEKANNFLGVVRDQKQEIARINSSVMSLGKFDSTINQMRIDFNRKIEEIENLRKQEAQIRVNAVNQDFKNFQNQFDAVKREIKQDYEKRLVVFIEENTQLVKKFKELQEKNKENIISSEELKIPIGILQQDVRKTKKQIETLKIDQDLFNNSQKDIRGKFETIMDSLRNNESRLNDFVATESERRQNQLDFIQTQTQLANERDRKWKDWNQDIETAIKQVGDILPDLQKQQFTMSQTKEELDSVTQQFERRIKEVTEMYRLMEEKYKKEWDTFRADAEKRWSNISLVLDDKQGGYEENLTTLQDRMIFIEDNNQEMQEVLLLMSSEIQKGMQGIMKMVNGWMEAFSQIKSS